MGLLHTELFGIHHFHFEFSVTLLERFLDIFRDSLAIILLDNDTVDHHFDRMFFGFAQFDLVVESHHDTVDHRPYIPFGDK
ncbi:hypothetical protein D1872_312630 [compost metagenome]